MATDLNFIEYIGGQLAGVDEKRYKKMFGEYMYYVNDKPVFLICDNTVYVKVIPQTDDFFGENGLKDYPYDGASQYYIVENIDDAEYLTRLALMLAEVLPLPKKRKK